MKYALAGLGGLLSILSGSQLASAQEWPNRTVTLILAFPAGGAIDSVSRVLADHLRNKFGRPFVVENRPGANGNIGAAAVAKAAPDGYTLMIATSAIVTNRYTYSKLAFDPTTLAPIALIAKMPLFIVGSKKLPVQSFKDILAYASAHPGTISVGTTGAGSQGHITTSMINKLTGANIVHVPYRDYPSIIPQLMSGDLKLGMIFMPFFVPQVREGLILGLAVAAEKRSAAVPDVPTVGELGYPELVSSGWFGIMGPPGISPGLVKAMNEAFNEFIASEPGRNALLHNALQPAAGSVEDFSAYLRNEYERWGPVIMDAKISLD